MKLKEPHIIFLRALMEAEPTHRKGLPVADNEQRRARQDCIRWRLVKYTREGWTTFPAGRAALMDGDSQPAPAKAESET